MLNRWLGISFAGLMLLANLAVFQRDVLPNWLVGDPPPNDAMIMQSGELRLTQVGIYRANGRHVGTSWTRARRVGTGFVNVMTITALEALAIGGVTTPPVRIETQITYKPNDAHVDELDFRIEGLEVDIWLHGEAMPSGEFPCEWQVGPHKNSFVLDSRAPAALGDVIRPFDRLPHLYVGRTWNMKLLDPLAQIFPQLRDSGLDLEPVRITVTGQERITHRGEEVDTFVVEGGGARAWVRNDGDVLRQTVTVPILGELTLVDEPYDEAARTRAVRRTAGGAENSRDARAAEWSAP